MLTDYRSAISDLAQHGDYRLSERTGFQGGSQIHTVSPLHYLCIYCFIQTDSERKTCCLNTQKGGERLLRELSAFGPHKWMRCLMRIVQLFYARHYVGDGMKWYMRAVEKKIVMRSCRHIAKFASMQKIRHRLFRSYGRAVCFLAKRDLGIADYCQLSRCRVKVKSQTWKHWALTLTYETL